MSVNPPHVSNQMSLLLEMNSEHEALMHGLYSFTELKCQPHDEACLAAFQLSRSALGLTTIITGNPDVPREQIVSSLNLYYLEDTLSAYPEPHAFEVAAAYLKIVDMATYDARCGRLMAVLLNIDVLDLPSALSDRKYTSAADIVGREWLEAGVFVGHDGAYLHFVDKRAPLDVMRLISIMNDVESMAMANFPKEKLSSLVWDAKYMHLRSR